MAGFKVKVEGLRELDRALAELPNRTGKAVLRRTLKRAAQPMADMAESLAPVRTDELQRSVSVSTKLARRQAKMHRRMFRNDRASAEMFVGAGVLPQAHLQEFGSAEHGAQPFMRPAWDAEKRPTLDRIKDMLAEEIRKAAERAERRAAKVAAKAKAG